MAMEGMECLEEVTEKDTDLVLEIHPTGLADRGSDPIVIDGISGRDLYWYLDQIFYDIEGANTDGTTVDQLVIRRKR
jgi:hypothetical protein